MSVDKCSLQDLEEIVKRNEVMLQESRNTITVPSSFILHVLAYLNRRRRSKSVVYIIILVFAYDKCQCFSPVLGFAYIYFRTQYVLITVQVKYLHLYIIMITPFLVYVHVHHYTLVKVVVSFQEGWGCINRMHAQALQTSCL